MDFDLRPMPSEPQSRAACLRCDRILSPTAFGWVHLDLPFDEVHPAEPGEPWLYDYTDPDWRPSRGGRSVLEARGLKGAERRRDSGREGIVESRPGAERPRGVERINVTWWPAPVRPLEGP